MKNNEFISFIVSRRKELHLSQNDLAASLGYSSQLIHNWEKGKSLPDLSILSALADALRLSLNDLLNAKVSEDRKEKYQPFDIALFSENLKKLRVFSSLTQKELAEKCGVSYATIISWEKGASTPNINQFVLLSELYKQSYEDLYFGRFTPNQKREFVKSYRVPFFAMTGVLVLSLLAGGHFVYKATSRGPDAIIDPPSSDTSDSTTSQSQNKDVIVKFYNFDRTLLWSTEAERGDGYVYQGAIPYRPSDDNYVYSFDKFVETSKEVCGDMTLEEKDVIYFIAQFLSHEVVGSPISFETVDVDGGIAVKGTDSTASEIVIPNKIGDKDVVGVFEYAFTNNHYLEKVTISEGIGFIGSSSFDGCECLTEVVLPESVREIRSDAFGRCISLSEIKMPKRIDSISEYAFAECENLSSMAIPYGLKSLENCLFTKCYRLSELSIPNSVETIGSGVINETKVKHLTIPSSVKTLEENCFWFSNLENIDLPEGVETIKKGFCNLENIDYAVLPKSLKKWFVREADFTKQYGRYYYRGSFEDFKNIRFFGYTPNFEEDLHIAFYSETPISGMWHYVDGIPVIY